MKNLVSRSANETKKTGRAIGKLLKAGDVVTLQGAIGAGKTTMAKGIVAGLGISKGKNITSPSFVLIHEYEGREKIFHIDWYRLDAVRDSDALFAQECFSSEAVTLVEWPERGKKILPAERLEIKLLHQGGDSRLLQIGTRGKKYRDFLKTLVKKGWVK